MAHVHKQTVTVVTNGSGAATEYSANVTGNIDRIQYIKPGSGGFADGSTFLITSESTGETLWGQTGVNASAVVAPRQPTHTTAGAAATYDGTRAVLDTIALVNDRIKIAITSGGDTKSGTFVITLR